MLLCFLLRSEVVVTTSHAAGAPGAVAVAVAVVERFFLRLDYCRRFDNQKEAIARHSCGHRSLRENGDRSSFPRQTRLK